MDDEPDSDESERGFFLRPEARILDEASLIPEANLHAPAEAFTHVVAVDEPYWYDRPSAAGDRPPDGVLTAGTQVEVLDEREDRSRVVDGRGLTVDVRRASLRDLGSGRADGAPDPPA